MARPNVFACDTFLFHPVEGKKLFPAGETDPGPAWADKIGGEPVGKGATVQAMKDLIAAQDQIDALGERLAAKDHDLGQLNAAKLEAEGKVADLEQRAIAAEQAQSAAESVAAELTRGRDDLAAQLSAANAKVAALDPEAAKVPGLLVQIEALNQEIAALSANIAAVDADGDGKVGGSKKKPDAA